MKSYFPMSGKKNARIEKLNKFWGGYKISIMRMNQAFVEYIWKYVSKGVYSYIVYAILVTLQTSQQLLVSHILTVLFPPLFWGKKDALFRSGHILQSRSFLQSGLTHIRMQTLLHPKSDKKQNNPYLVRRHVGLIWTKNYYGILLLFWSMIINMQQIF